MYKLILVALFALFANASQFALQSGTVLAHTEVFGDSEINPASKEIQSTLSSEEDISSLRGNISIKALSLNSDTPKRDANMYELLNATIHPEISVDIINVVKNEKGYTIEGFLTLNGIKRKIESLATIIKQQDVLLIKGDFNILLTQFGMEPPKLLFLTVRDQIDITYTLSYNKE